MFKDCLKTWNSKLATDGLIQKLKLFMHEEYQALQVVDDLTITDSFLTQANSVQELRYYQIFLRNS